LFFFLNLNCGKLLEMPILGLLYCDQGKCTRNIAIEILLFAGKRKSVLKKWIYVGFSKWHKVGRHCVIFFWHNVGLKKMTLCRPDVMSFFSDFMSVWKNVRRCVIFCYELTSVFKKWHKVGPTLIHFFSEFMSVY
jgi:hypothetical protein